MIIYSNSDWEPTSYAKGGKGGGPSTFMSYLGEYLRSHGHETTNNADDDYDLHFFPSLSSKNLFRSLRKSIPIVTRLNGVPSAPNLSRFWKIYVRPFIFLDKMTHRTIYQSDFCKMAWSSLNMGSMQARSVVIYNGADVSLFHPKDNKSSRSKNNKLLLHEQFRRDDGGLRTALQAFIFVKKKIPAANLILAGQLSGPMPEVVEKFMSNEEISVGDSIEILGRTDHSILPDLIRSADVYIHPVPNSSCPHTALEVLSCGVPVICYSGTGPAEFVGESGIVLKSEYEGVRNGFKRFPREDPQQLADAIIEILKNKETYKAKAYSRAQLFSSDITCEKYLEAFEEAVRHPPNPISLQKATWQTAKLLSARVLAKIACKYEAMMKRNAN